MAASKRKKSDKSTRPVNQGQSAYSKYDAQAYDTTGVVKTLWFFPWFRRWYVSWINRNLPRSREITLDRNRVFVFPTARGLLFIICAFCVFLAGTNYSNNLILASGFLLFSLFVVTIWHSFLNILGLTVKAGGAEPIFLGDYAHFKITLQRPGEKTLFALKLIWPGASEMFTNIEEHQVQVRVPVEPGARGYFFPPRLTIETRYPFGIIRCWSHVALDSYCVVYPKPIENTVYLGEGHEGLHGEEINFQSNEELYELKKYQDGDNLNHVAWKSFSKGLGLRTKRFAGFQDEAVWLQWDVFRAYEHELRISYLCYWVLQFEKQKRPYGLDIPGYRIDPDSGERHLKQCLHALATFDSQTLQSRSGDSAEMAGVRGKVA